MEKINVSLTENYVEKNITMLGENLIDMAEDVARDIDGVVSISIKWDLDATGVPTLKIEKKYKKPSVELYKLQ